MRSMRAAFRCLATGLCALALPLTVGCHSRRYFVGFELPGGGEAELRVLGKQLRIQVDNAGPGTVLLVFDPPGDARDEGVEIGVGTTIRSMPGPVRLRCASSGESGATLAVRAWGCKGMSLDQTPEARTPPGPDS